MRRVPPVHWRVIAAFAAVYLIWGSTYLAIRLAIETIPPLLMAGVRFLVAGAVLLPLALLSGDRHGDRLTLAHWRSALVIGALLLVGGNGGVTLAEQRVPSGITALLVATVPLWIAALAHLRGVQRLSRLGGAGLLVGFLGVALLLRPGSAGGAPPLWMGLTLIAPLSWAAGSVYARGAPMPRRPLVATALEMLCGGTILFTAATALGEWGQVRLAAISAVSVGAFAYLVVAGSLLGYSAYIFLLRSVSPRAASSYAYVNPLVAVALGWAVLGEPITPMTLVAAALIVVAVAVLLGGSRRREGEGLPGRSGEEPEQAIA